jgi:hypothetical protein
MKDLIYMTTTTNASVLANGVIPLTTIQRRTGCALQDGTNSIIFRAAGYYKVNGSITFTAPVAGDVTIVAQKSNINIPGITASTTITTADTEIRTLNINGIVKVFCSERGSSLTLVNSNIAITVQNVSLDVEYLG